MSNLLGFLAAGGAACGAAFFAGLPLVFACFLGVSVIGICLGVSSISKVAPAPELKTKKSKKEKKTEKAAPAKAAPVKDDDEADSKAAEKAAKKRDKERARKVARREAAEQEKQAAEAAELAAKTEKAAKEAEVTADKKKKKKKKAKKDSVKADDEEHEEKQETKKAEVVVTERDVRPTEKDPWEEVKQKKIKKKVEAVETSDNDVHMETVSIERKYFGLIIGPAGATLKTIADGTGTSIEIPKDGSMHADLIIITGSVEGCTKAKQTLFQLVMKGYSDLTHGAVTDASISVPDKKRSVLIGPGGLTIKLIEEKLSVKINMPDKGSEDDVTVVGSDENIKETLNCIRQLITQGYSDITHPTFVKECIEIDRSQLGNLMGPKGTTIRALQDSTNVKINIEGTTVTVIGEAQDVQDAKAKILSLTFVPEAAPIAAEWTKAASLQWVNAW